MARYSLPISDGAYYAECVMASGTTSSNGWPAKVNLFVTCLVDQFAPNVGMSVVNILEARGIEVHFPPDQTCCGQPAFNSGFRNDAYPVAARFLDIFEATDGPIVCPSGSCVAMVRNFYKDLFREHPEDLARAQALSERIYEFTEFIVDVLGIDDLDVSVDLDATYHRCCHLLRELHVDTQPATLLSNVDGLDLKSLHRDDVCCGFGGAFSVKMSEISSAMLEEKLDNVVAAGASHLISGDTGCILHMQGGLRRRGADVQVVHIAEVLDANSDISRTATS